ncbi:MAG TPA: hypothetical protein VGY76_03345 [Solirubrobacteraceae bacterium]|jgi:hypothetical protein|nr:hypothetical protein [Solirubrobacteraceae bacterium]
MTDTTISTRHPLYAELALIGRRDRSIKPEYLGDYDRLMQCSEVRRRAGADASPSELAEHASQAIADAVQAIPRPDVRQVGEAALCVLTRYEGLSPNEREDRLWETPDRVTKDQYKERRRAVLKSVVIYLERKSDASTVLEKIQSTPVRLTDATEQDKIVLDLRTIGEIAADMHFAALACSFVDNFQGFQPDNPGDYFPDRWEVWDACQNRLLETMINFAIHYEGDNDDEAFADACSQHLNSDEIDQCLLYLQTVHHSSPPVASDTRQRIIQYRSDLINGTTQSDDPLWHLRRDVLRPWYENWPDLVAIAAASGRLALLIARTVSYETPVLSESRRRAYKSVAYFYDFDDLEPAFNGQSLREKVQTHFDTESARLTSGAFIGMLGD